MLKYASRICAKCRAVLPIVGWDLFVLNARWCLCLALVGGRPVDCMCESSQNQMACLPPPFLFLFLLEYGRWLYFNKNIGGLYAYNLVSCVDSLIRVGVAKLAPVSKRASRSTRFAWNVTVAPGLLR